MSDKGLFESGAVGGGGGWFGGVFGGLGCAAGDLEVEFAEEGFGEIGMLITAFEDDAMEFILRDCNWPVAFFLTTASEPIQEFRV